jgi:hypothetical protein
MKAVLSCFIFLALLLTISCSSAMPGNNSNGNNNGGGPTGSSSVVISSISPSSVSSGAQDFTLTIVGTGFPASPSIRQDRPEVIFWSSTQDGVYLGMDWAHCDATHLIATVPADLVQNAGTFNVQVQIFHFADDGPKAVSNIVQLLVGSGPWDY